MCPFVPQRRHSSRHSGETARRREGERFFLPPPPPQPESLSRPRVARAARSLSFLRAFFWAFPALYPLHLRQRRRLQPPPLDRHPLLDHAGVAKEPDQILPGHEMDISLPRPRLQQPNELLHRFPLTGRLPHLEELEPPGEEGHLLQVHLIMRELSSGTGSAGRTAHLSSYLSWCMTCPCPADSMQLKNMLC